MQEKHHSVFYLINSHQIDWSNEDTMIQYIEDVIAPFAWKKRDELQVGPDQAALAIFNHFNGQLAEKNTYNQYFCQQIVLINYNH